MKFLLGVELNQPHNPGVGIQKARTEDDNVQPHS